MENTSPRGSMARYLAAETLIGVAINGLLVSATLLIWPNPIAKAPAMVTAPLVMGGFMSALVPSLLTRHRLRTGHHATRWCGQAPMEAMAVAALVTPLALLLLFAPRKPRAPFGFPRLAEGPDRA